MKKILSIFLALVVLFSFSGVSYAEDNGRLRNERAREHMSIVAREVEILLQMREDKGGIGESVREIARSQKDSQSEVDTEFQKLENRSQLMKKLFGTDFKAVRNLRQQIEQNNLRIMQLQELAKGVQNVEDKNQIEEAIQAITNQNIALEEAIQAEEQLGSTFGWLVKLLS